ncbi:hypothetical protein BG910_01520 [Neisseria chenwenguii]|uniref:Uncharacterized protein n=1 Tax=Neisseria chenwenguii TaxID=1853278 RepID=A0A220RZN2_9NEIS|nr:hypothetical protein [Neisseria chenwenguii]ASK26598.1 hypothetical protein BG910_01520 [Neisseria chenwenguii]
MNNAGSRLTGSTAATVEAAAVGNGQHTGGRKRPSERESQAILSNLGLINSGGLTRVEAAEIENAGSGRIYGNHIALAAGRLNNYEENADGTTRAAVVTARERLDIGATEIHNREGGLIASEGSLYIGGRLNGQNRAEGTAQRLTNGSAHRSKRGCRDCGGRFAESEQPFQGGRISGREEACRVLYACRRSRAVFCCLWGIQYGKGSLKAVLKGVNDVGWIEKLVTRAI